MTITNELETYIKTIQEQGKEKISETVDSLINTSKEQLENFINFAKNSELPFIKEQGQKALEYTEALATGKISNDNYQNLMLDLRDLTIIEEKKIKVKYKVEMEIFKDNLRNIFINGLIRIL